MPGGFTLAGGALLIMATLALWAYAERTGRLAIETDLVQLQADKAQLGAALESANRNVERMLDQALEDNRIVSEVIREKQAITADLEDLRAQLQTIEASDETSRDYLRTPVPAGVRGLANRPARGNPRRLPGPAGSAPGAAGGPVPPGDDHRRAP